MIDADDPVLAAARADPADDTARLVLADWVDDRWAGAGDLIRRQLTGECGTVGDFPPAEWAAYAAVFLSPPPGDMAWDLVRVAPDGSSCHFGLYRTGTITPRASVDVARGLPHLLYARAAELTRDLAGFYAARYPMVGIVPDPRTPARRVEYNPAPPVSGFGVAAAARGGPAYVERFGWHATIYPAFPPRAIDLDNGYVPFTVFLKLPPFPGMDVGMYPDRRAAIDALGAAYVLAAREPPQVGAVAPANARVFGDDDPLDEKADGDDF